MADEAKMASVGYFKGRMCPFTQINVHRWNSKFVFTDAQIKAGSSTHIECLKEYCAIWDKKNKQCSIKTIAENSFRQ